mmetsp:Transcript_12503/g.36909  ORF Transcript_12503/g.36909 Transcript_12503/m.36909 type:complete len:121 (+) Transcript_12503:1327-1689(+)
MRNQRGYDNAGDDLERGSQRSGTLVKSIDKGGAGLYHPPSPMRNAACFLEKYQHAVFSLKPFDRAFQLVSGPLPPLWLESFSVYTSRGLQNAAIFKFTRWKSAHPKEDLPPRDEIAEGAP